MSKNAAIYYIRTSSEHQAEKASPEEQERDCRSLAELHGLTVVAVYRDVERYRAKTRLVDPSGTRTDRPALLRLLRDAAEGQFGTILAWKEDRLYRGLRAMLLVLDALQEHKLTVILAKEIFDPRMAPVKAWVAGMELDALKERMTMGVKARLRAGKANTGQDRYGYRREGERIIVIEEEARWVRQVFDWYIDRTPMLEIRRRLIAASAPQKGSTRPRKIQWAVSSIQGILKAAYEFAYGVKIQTRDGDVFTIPVEPLITEEVYRRFLAVREDNKSYPARNVKRDYLIGGLIYCPCGRRWGTRISSIKKKDQERAKPTGVYFCPERHVEQRHADCAKTIGSKKADMFVWGKVLEVLRNPDLLLGGVRHYMTELQARAKVATVERDRIAGRLEEIGVERQWVITQARRGAISTADMETQLGALTMEEGFIRGELVNVNTVYEAAMRDDWESTAREYLNDLGVGVLSLETEPQTEEEGQELFRLRRQAVQSLVERVDIGKDRKMSVVFRMDALSLLGIDSKSVSDLTELRAIYSAGTYSRKFDCILPAVLIAVE